MCQRRSAAGPGDRIGHIEARCSGRCRAPLTILIVGFGLPIASGPRTPASWPSPGGVCLAPALVAGAHGLRRSGWHRGRAPWSGRGCLDPGACRDRGHDAFDRPAQAFRVILPPLTNELVPLLATPAAGRARRAIGQRELTTWGRTISNAIGNYTPLIAVAVRYLVITPAADIPGPMGRASDPGGSSMSGERPPTPVVGPGAAARPTVDIRGLAELRVQRRAQGRRLPRGPAGGRGGVSDRRDRAVHPAAPVNLPETPIGPGADRRHRHLVSRTLTSDVVRRRIGMVFQQFNLFAHSQRLDNVTTAQRKVLKRSGLPRFRRSSPQPERAPASATRPALLPGAARAVSSSGGDRPSAGDGPGDRAVSTRRPRRSIRSLWATC